MGMAQTEMAKAMKASGAKKRMVMCFGGSYCEGNAVCRSLFLKNGDGQWLSSRKKIERESKKIRRNESAQRVETIPALQDRVYEVQEV